MDRIELGGSALLTPFPLTASFPGLESQPLAVAQAVAHLLVHEMPRKEKLAALVCVCVRVLCTLKTHARTLLNKVG